MKRFVNIILLLATTVASFAQSSVVSQPMSFQIKKNYVPPLLNVVPHSQSFTDQDNNGVIDANEQCKIRFQIENTGKGDAFGCVAKVVITGATQGVTMKDVTLSTIAAGTKHWVEIPITANANTQTGEIAFSIVVDEPNGYGTDPINGTLGTHKLRTPYVQVASYKVSGSKGGKLNKRETFKLQVIVQNTDQGTAENVNIRLRLPQNVNWTGGTDEQMTIASLRPNETQILEYELMANAKAAENIDIQMALSERTGKYAKDASIPLSFGQYIGSSIALEVERNDEEVVITTASLTSDVDENIPVTNTKNTNTFVLIIANEHYQQVANVPYALNDGNIFREYCIKTLGISNDHIKYFADATGNNIKTGINWLSKAYDAHGGKDNDIQMIVYYAGHGIPDNNGETAYLLPIDGSAMDMSTGYKLDNLYKTLGMIPAKRITIFLDACFSGSRRGDGMIVSARSVVLEVKSGVPQGNMVVFSAAQGKETAFPYDEQQHGMFTYYLLKKLQETKGDVSLYDLGSDVITKVKQKTFDTIGKTQTPMVTPSATVGTQWQSWKMK